MCPSRFSAIFAVLCVLAGSPAIAAAPDVAGPDEPHHGISIRVEEQGWGTVTSGYVESVLYAVADEFVAHGHVPAKLSIAVANTTRNPIILYERGQEGEYRVLLHAKDNHWSLYVYEFAHELCHILSNYDRNADEGAARRNRWFEESLCEAASLYALQAVGNRWAGQIPASEWQDRGQRLRSFFAQLVAEPHRHLDADTSFAAWLRTNESTLRRNPHQREMNDLVALKLIPLFERSTAGWRAVRYLNLDASDDDVGLTAYLQHWYEHAPDADKTFIESVRALFAVDDEKSLLSFTDAAAPH